MQFVHLKGAFQPPSREGAACAREGNEKVCRRDLVVRVGPRSAPTWPALKGVTCNYR
jgi:hypothetical protein